MLTFVLVDFWTYCCVSWMYASTHITALHAKYRDRGRVGGDVYPPGFPFERSTRLVLGGRPYRCEPAECHELRRRCRFRCSSKQAVGERSGDGLVFVQVLNIQASHGTGRLARLATTHP